MNDAIFRFGVPESEPTLSYAPGSKERTAIKEELDRQSGKEVEIPLIIGGKEVRTGNTGQVVMPHDHNHRLAVYHKAGPAEAEKAIGAAMKAKKEWMDLSWDDRGALMSRIAQLLSGKYRNLINAATMLGQGKNIYQAEIDAVCESTDYLYFDTYAAGQIYGMQPVTGRDNVNRVEYRPLEGFVFAVSPFNFTAIALNLNIAPVMMGNTTVWKPSRTAILSGYYLMKLYEEAGLPAGVINFLPGESGDIAPAILRNADLGGIHFTGSTATFKTLWKETAENLDKYRTYPRLVGETGGKDFIVAHASADPEELVTAMIRGAFEYQGQKCSAASRAYIPRTLWNGIKDELIEITENLKVGDVKDFRNFVNAVIDEESYDKIMGYIEKAKESDDAEILAGGKGDKSRGYFVRPTLVEVKAPHFVTMEEEIFGPVLSIYVYEDGAFEETLETCDKTSPYALTGSVFAKDRYAIEEAKEKLKYAAGNFYVNDKPTGAMVGLQPFGGGRASGTNDKAGSYMNLLRWVNPRTIKDNANPARHYAYSFMEEA